MATKKVLNDTVKKQYIALHPDDDYRRSPVLDSLQECADYVRYNEDEDPGNWLYYEVTPIDVEVKVVVVDKTIVEAR